MSRPHRLLSCLLASLLCGPFAGCDPQQDDDSAIEDDDVTADDDDTTGEQGPQFVPSLSDPDLTLYPVCADGALAEFSAEAIDAPGAGSEGYVAPTQATLDALRAGIEAVVGGDVTAALAALDGTAYQVCRGTGDEQALIVVEPTTPGTGQPLLAVRMVEASPLILGIPHPVYELGTLTQGTDLLRELRARALVVAGAHRCANAAQSPCDGSTDVCTGAGEEPFRDSDMAHVVDSVFQVAHEVLVGAYPEAWVASIHGMEEEGISLSDGTLESLDSDSPVARLYAALATVFPEEPLTSCNEFDGAVVELRYCGEFNAQGRLTNGSAWPCELDPPGSSDRFVHLEQSLAVRAETDRVREAFEAALGLR